MFHRFSRLFTSRSETHYQFDVYIKNAVLLAAMRKNHNRCKGPRVIAYLSNRLATQTLTYLCKPLNAASPHGVPRARRCCPHRHNTCRRIGSRVLLFGANAGISQRIWL
ncbi:hypothetical protein AAB26_16315 [Salmonella enterica subsp. houtenae]|nr:hypothetical protein [Salmonella enterica subsp. houtenae]EAN3151378.1 hypothetical protein [Salmonella enterica]EAQ6165759.1 hypothetical protein [Salmonella enterica]EAU3063996.1 hypothetical protein [Salmonella enterica]EAV0021680.1 hypothetical protein [Salmonella enterica]